MAIVADNVWLAGPQQTVTELLQARLDSDPDSEYLDVCGTKLTARERRRHRQPARRVRCASSASSPATGSPRCWRTPRRCCWPGSRPSGSGAVSVPVNTAYKGEYLRHQLGDSGRPGAHRGRRPRRAGRAPSATPSRRSNTSSASAAPARCPASARSGWDDVLAAAPVEADRRAPVRARDLRLHRRHDRPFQGLHADAQLPRRRWRSRSATAGNAPATTWCGRRCRCFTSTPW